MLIYRLTYTSTSLLTYPNTSEEEESHFLLSIDLWFILFWKNTEKCFSLALILILFWGVGTPCLVASGILVFQPEIEPMPLAVKTHSLNYWTTRESPDFNMCISVILQTFKNESIMLKVSVAFKICKNDNQFPFLSDRL